jgi:SAM-dependent methyltransferase
MGNITDDRGYNQVWRPSLAMEVRTERRARAILDAMTLARPNDILEVGSGTGELSAYLSENTQANIIGADLCEPFVEAAEATYGNARLSFRVVDLLHDDLDLKLEQRRFDYIVGNGILHHLHDDLPTVLPRLRALLKSRGRLVFWEPNLQNPYVYLIFSFQPLRKRAKLEPDEMAFTRKRLAGAFGAAGFSDVSIEPRDFLLPNVPDRFIQPMISFGTVAERVPGLRAMAQSLFVSASA